MRPSRRHPRLTPLRAVVASVTAVTVGAVGVLAAATPARAGEPTQVVGASSRLAPSGLYLVTLRTPGTSATPGPLSRTLDAARVLQEQEDVLSVLTGLGAPPPVYRWTTAINGFAVELDRPQVDQLSALPQVRSVERDTLRRVAAGTIQAASAIRPATVAGPARGGDGVVIGVVDTGLAPDSPVFAQRSSPLPPTSFDGRCETAPDWDASECSGKIVGARTYVAGFGVDDLRAATSVSPRDLDGHGTRTASLAAGNADVPVVVDGERLGTFGGQAPDALLAVYKACWSAPDPADDGCSTADLVSAVDDATREGVDVLTLAVDGPGGIDTLERALLGAAESGVVVVGAAGNDGAGSAAHTSPWVTTVGGADGDVRRGELVLTGGRRLAGAMQSRRIVPASRIVRAEDAAAEGATADAARVCTPGSLDAARVAGAVVVCERGRVGRVDKSRAVALADGAAMVLLNSGPGSVDADLHRVPTVHLSAGPARELRRWLAGSPGRVRLRPLRAVDPLPRVAGFSGSGVSTGTYKPDVVAPASNVLAAVPAAAGSWDVASGTSSATAHTAGVAATLLGRGASPAEVRSALVTTALPLRDGVLRGGVGLLRPSAAADPGLAYLLDRSDYRDWLDEGSDRLNTPSVVLSGGQLTTTRRITNVSGRRLYFSSSADGFRRDVTVRPAAVRLGPGESVTFRVQVSRRGANRLDDGYVVWRGATGTVTRIPVVLTR